ncbi:MAG: hypothetical protein WBO24_14010 [Nitrospirales bacterium]
MNTIKVSVSCVVLGLLPLQFSGWQLGIQIVYGENNAIDFSKIELGDSERKVIVNKAINFYKGHPGGPDIGMPIVGSEKTKDLTLGEALKIFHIRMDRIQNYQSGTKPEDVLFPAEGGIVAIYKPNHKPNQQPGDKLNIFSYAPLILSDGDKPNSKKYQAGLPRVRPDYDLLYESWKEIEQEKTGPPFGIFYPVTGQYFLGYINESGEFKIKVLHDGPGYLKKGENLKAQDVFVELANDAKQRKYIEYEASGNPLERFRQFQKGQ